MTERIKHWRELEHKGKRKKTEKATYEEENKQTEKGNKSDGKKRLKTYSDI